MHVIHVLVATLALVVTFARPAAAEPALSIKPLAEKKVAALPDGPLYWRIETFATREDAAAAAGPSSLVVESAGTTWLFTLGASGGSTPGARRVADVGPIPRIEAGEYLLRINEATGAPGAVTPVHTHPGSEAFYVLRGEQSIRGSRGALRVVRAGEAEAGSGADHAMQVSSSGAEPLHALVMFVVDAKRPFSSPSMLE
jgi:quercetin dioxygenase-like cupin family protein